MNITLAYQTLRAIDECIRRDQGAAFRQNLQRVLPHITDAYRGEDEGFRSHLGASLIGRECSRELWYGFRWAHKGTFSGQMLRLFNRGHLEEGRFIALLLTMGVQVFQQDANGNQYRISEYGGHFGGSGDGVVMNIPDIAPGTPALSEFKTHNTKSFNKLAGTNWKKFYEAMLDPKLPQVAFEGDGVRTTKFEHWVQMQIYMRKMGLAVAVYVAVHKDTDLIYIELVHLDSDTADKFITRAGTIVGSEVPPPPINKSAGWGACMFCDYKKICKESKPVMRNCRTCQYAEPNMQDGKWYCNNAERLGTITKNEQLIGCNRYIKINAL